MALLQRKEVAYGLEGKAAQLTESDVVRGGGRLQQVSDDAGLELAKIAGPVTVEGGDGLELADQEKGEGRALKHGLVSPIEDVAVNSGLRGNQDQPMIFGVIVVHAAGQPLDPPRFDVQIGLNRVETAGGGILALKQRMVVNLDLEQTAQEPAERCKADPLGL